MFCSPKSHHVWKTERERLLKACRHRYAFGSTEFHVLRPSHAIHAKFLYYYTFNPVFRAYAAENMSGRQDRNASGIALLERYTTLSSSPPGTSADRGVPGCELRGNRRGGGR